MELIKKHQMRDTFDLDKIQEEIVVHYIAGKILIDRDCRAKLCKHFHYRLTLPTEQNEVRHPAE